MIYEKTDPRTYRPIRARLCRACAIAGNWPRPDHDRLDMDAFDNTGFPDDFTAPELPEWADLDTDEIGEWDRRARRAMKTRLKGRPKTNEPIEAAEPERIAA